MSSMPIDVMLFLKACDQDQNPANAELYNTLIVEEFNEFMQAVATNDNVEQLDACMDMIWVILGYCCVKKFDAIGAWNEVARSNMSKIDPTTGKVIRREDGKILKPEGWKPPDLSKYV